LRVIINYYNIIITIARPKIASSTHDAEKHKNLVCCIAIKTDEQYEIYSFSIIIQTILIRDRRKCTRETARLKSTILRISKTRTY
jgi:hypothetical protein